MAAAEPWARWRPEIAKACDGSHNTIESIDKALANGSQCLIAHETHCYVVSIDKYPAETVCQVWWAAGDLEACVEGLHELHRWARANGCTEMLIEGNPAWQRALKHLDYRVFSVTLTRRL